MVKVPPPTKTNSISSPLGAVLVTIGGRSLGASTGVTVILGESEPGRALVGKSVAEIAAERGADPVDAFFETVLVNADDADLRANRLRLLAALRDTTREVADFSAISG